MVGYASPNKNAAWLRPNGHRCKVSPLRRRSETVPPLILKGVPDTPLTNKTPAGFLVFEAKVNNLKFPMNTSPI